MQVGMPPDRFQPTPTCFLGVGGGSRGTNCTGIIEIDLPSSFAGGRGRVCTGPLALHRPPCAKSEKKVKKVPTPDPGLRFAALPPRRTTRTALYHPYMFFRGGREVLVQKSHRFRRKRLRLMHFRSVRSGESYFSLFFHIFAPVRGQPGWKMCEK